MDLNEKFTLQNVIMLVKRANKKDTGPVRFDDVMLLNSTDRDETAHILRRLQDCGYIDYNQHKGYSVYPNGYLAADLGYTLEMVS